MRFDNPMNESAQSVRAITSVAVLQSKHSLPESEIQESKAYIRPYAPSLIQELNQHIDHLGELHSRLAFMMREVKQLVK